MIRQPRMTLATLGTALVGFLGTIALGGFSAAWASHSVSSHYSYALCDEARDGPVDPIGAIFRGEYGTANLVADAIQHHSDGRWEHDDPEVPINSSQGLLVKTEGGEFVCQDNETERASESNLPPDFATERYHVRLWRIPARVGPNATTVGTPHYEIATDRGDCGEDVVVPIIGTQEVPTHAVTVDGFDKGRHQVRQFIERGGHPVSVVNWGNTKRVTQCTDVEARSSGNVLQIRMDHPPRHN